MTHRKNETVTIGKKNRNGHGYIYCVGTDSVNAFLPSKAVGPVFEKIMRHVVDLWNDLPPDEQGTSVLSYSMTIGIGQSDVTFHVEHWTQENRIVVAFPHEATAQQPAFEIPDEAAVN